MCLWNRDIPGNGVITHCGCGLTGGCELCNPFHWKLQYETVPPPPKGWICPKCDTANNPDNKMCAKCTSAAITSVTFDYTTGFTDITFDTDAGPYEGGSNL
jgi:hypothetical protein